MRSRSRSPSALDMLQRELGNQWINRNAPFPTQARPQPPPMQWTDQASVMNPADTSNYGPGSPFGQQPPSPELLAQMQQWWDQTQAPQQQIAALPEAVQRSIREQPSYGEGEIMAPHPWYNPAIEEHERILPLESPERRENALNNELGFSNYMRRESPWAAPEGGVATSMPPGQSPFASPLNQLLQRRGPFALY
jgi:hypothetical protein